MTKYRTSLSLWFPGPTSKRKRMHRSRFKAFWGNWVSTSHQTQANFSPEYLTSGALKSSSQLLCAWVQFHQVSVWYNVCLTFTLVDTVQYNDKCSSSFIIYGEVWQFQIIYFFRFSISTLFIIIGTKDILFGYTIDWWKIGIQVYLPGIVLYIFLSL